MWGVLGAGGAEFMNLPKSDTNSKTWTQEMRERETNLLDPAPPVDRSAWPSVTLANTFFFTALPKWICHVGCRERAPRCLTLCRWSFGRVRLAAWPETCCGYTPSVKYLSNLFTLVMC